MIARRFEVHVMNKDLPEPDRALSGQRLDKLALAVPGNASDSDDLARMHLEVEAAHRIAPFVIFGIEARDFERRAALRRDSPRGGGANDRVPDHHGGHFAVRDRADLTAADPGAAPQYGEVVAERLDLAELVADHRDRDLATMRHVAQQTQNLVGLARGQHGGGLVEDKEALVEVEELENLELLLFAGRQSRHRPVERHAERHPVEEGFQRLALLAPIND